MKRLERILARLTPKRWPVRWRLAAVSAALTLVILVAFAVVVGHLTSNRIQGNFDNELRDNSAQAAAQVQISQNLSTGRPQCHLGGEGLLEDAAIRVVASTGIVCQTPGAPSLGAPHPGTVADVGSLRVATTPAFVV